MHAIYLCGGLATSPRLRNTLLAPHELLDQFGANEGGLVGRCRALQSGTTAQWCETNYAGFPKLCECDGVGARYGNHTTRLRSDADARPNILLVLTDDHGYTDLGGAIDSNVVTPWLGELRRNGASLAHAYATAPQCAPSRAGLLSGRNQNSFGLWRNEEDAGFGPSTLPPHVMTIAEHLKGLGYQTGMAGKWHLGNLSDPKKGPGARGFDWYFAGEINQYYANFKHDGSVHSWQRTIDKRNRIDVTGDMAEAFVDHHVDVPWFFYWAPYGPHHPMLEDDDPHLQGFEIQPYPFYTAAENEARRKGLAMVKLIDMRFGRIVQRLRERKLEESTLIIFSSDNGAPLGLRYDADSALDGFRREAWQRMPHPSPRGPHAGEALKFVRDPSNSYVGSENVPLRGGKGGTWEGGIKVPMFIYWKGKIAPQAISRAITTLDLTATIAHAAGMTERPAQHFDGVSLLPLLTGTPGQQQFPSHLYWFGTLGDTAVQSGNWKLRVSKSTYLFDLAADPLELYDLAQSHKVGGPKKVGELRMALRAWTDSLPFEKACGNGCSLEPIRRPNQPCTPQDVDVRFARYSAEFGNVFGKHQGHPMCWPAPLLEG